MFHKLFDGIFFLLQNVGKATVEQVTPINTGLVNTCWHHLSYLVMILPAML